MSQETEESTDAVVERELEDDDVEFVDAVSSPLPPSNRSVAAVAEMRASQMSQDAFLADLESQYVDLRTERDELAATVEEREKELQQAFEKNHELNSQDKQTAEALASTERRAESEHHSRLEAEARAEALAERADRVEAESDRLRQEITRLTEEKKQESHRVAELEVSQKLTSSESVPLQYQVERLTKELESTQAHSNFLEKELTGRTEQLFHTKEQHSLERGELESRLDKASRAKDSAESELESLKHLSSQQTNQMDKIARELRQVRQESSDANLSYEEEAHAQNKLLQLQKEQLDRLMSRHDAICRQLEFLKDEATKAAQTATLDIARAQTEAQSQSQYVLEQLKSEHIKQMDILKAQLEEAQKKRRDAEEGLFLSSPSRRRALTASRSATAMDEEEEPMSLTDLYQRLSETEDHLHSERTERKRYELYLRKIQADIAAKTPVLAKQRKQYDLLVKRDAESRTRLDEALQESQHARKELQGAEQEIRRLEQESNVYRQETVDLAQQVQRLLQNRASSGNEENSFVTFDNIAELQQQNQKLLQDHHRFTETISDLEKKLDSDTLVEKLEESTSELESLKEERERQSTLVAAIVQQRDLYRALLSKHDGRLLRGDETDGEDLSETPLILARQKQDQSSQEMAQLEAQNNDLMDEVAKLKAEYTEHKSTSMEIEGRLARLDAHCINLSSSLDKAQSELSAAHADSARNKADAAYYKDKCVRVEESMQALKNEIQRARESRGELQRVNEGLQQALSAANTNSSKYQLQLDQSKASVRMAETKVETYKAAESRIMMDCTSLRTELARQGALMDSVQRIEATLSAKSSTEQEHVKEEMERQAQSFLTERAKYATEVETLQNRAGDLELQLKEVDAKKNAAMIDMVKAKEEVVHVVAEKQALTDKVSALEHELVAAKKKLGDMVVTDEDRSWETKLDSIAGELEAARAQLQISQQRVKDYEGIAKSSEKALADLTSATETFKADQTALVDQLRTDLEASKRSSASQREALEELATDLSNQRGEQETIVTELNSRIKSLENDLEIAKKNVDAASLLEKSLHSEMKSYRDDATSNQRNYEQELAGHAEALKKIRTVQTEADAEINLRKTVEGQLVVMKAEADNERGEWAEQRISLEEKLKETTDRLEEARGHNKVLHDQMATLTASVDKLQNERIINLSETSGDSPTEGVDESDELNILRKSVSELREVVQFMRSEREMFEAQTETARRTAERERASSTILKRSLEEARTELKLLQVSMSKNDTGANTVAVEKELKVMEDQLRLLRESNQLLREDSEKVSSKLVEAHSEAEEAKKSLEPVQTRCRILEVDKTALETEKTSLTREVDAWKARVQSLVSRFHQIDPEDHKKLVKELDEAKTGAEALKLAKDKADLESKSAKSLVSRLNKELSNHKALVESTKAMLAKISSEKETLVKTNVLTGDALQKECEELKEESKKTKAALALTKTELSSSTTRIGNLTNILRKLKDANEKSRLEVAQARASEKAALAREQEAAKASAKALASQPPKQPETLQKIDKSSETKTVVVPEQEAMKSGQTAMIPELQEPETTKRNENTDGTVTQPPPAKSTEPAIPEKDVQVSAVNSTDAGSTATTTGITSMETTNAKEPKLPDDGFKFAPSRVGSSPTVAASEGKKDSDKDISSTRTGSKPPVVKNKGVVPTNLSSDAKPFEPVHTTAQIKPADKEASITVPKPDQTKGLETGASTVPAKESQPKSSEMGVQSISVVKRPAATTSDQSAAPVTETKEEKLRARLMKKKRELAERLANKLVEKGTEPEAKRLRPSSSAPTPVKSQSEKQTVEETPVDATILVKMVEETDTQKSNDGTAVPSLEPALKVADEKGESLTTTEEGKAESPSKVSSSEKPVTSPFGSAGFAASIFDAAAKKAGSPKSAGFGSALTKPAVFGSGTSVPSFGAAPKPQEGISGFGQVAPSPIGDGSASSGGAFLNLNPPGTDKGKVAAWSFGSNASITLPMPSKKSVPPLVASFGAFGTSPSPSSSGSSLFGPGKGDTSTGSSSNIFGDASKKRSSSPGVFGAEPTSAKQPRFETTGDEISKTSKSTEEGNAE